LAGQMAGTHVASLQLLKLGLDYAARTTQWKQADAVEACHTPFLLGREQARSSAPVARDCLEQSGRDRGAHGPCAPRAVERGRADARGGHPRCLRALRARALNSPSAAAPAGPPAAARAGGP